VKSVWRINNAKMASAINNVNNGISVISSGGNGEVSTNGMA
jgi:hypothetical protein